MSAAADHGFYPPVPIVERPVFHWPGRKALALGLVVSVEYYEMQPPPGAFIPPNVPGGFGRGPYPDFRNYGARAYGTRAGVPRLLDLFSSLGLKATFAVDALTARYTPGVIAQILREGHEIAAHGQSVTRVVSEDMPEHEERAYIASVCDTLAQSTGIAPRGWHGPEYGESSRTPTLLAEAGFDYLLDWPNDEQPVRMVTASGPLFAMPMLVDFDDVYAIAERRLSVTRWAQAVRDGVAQLIKDGRTSGRMLILNLHPWLIGHPHRIDVLAALLHDLAADPDILSAPISSLVDFIPD